MRLSRMGGRSHDAGYQRLTDHSHPCQALSDLMTIQESKAGLKDLAWPISVTKQRGARS